MLKIFLRDDDEDEVGEGEAGEEEDIFSLFRALYF
jgi:hypothetical protein